MNERDILRVLRTLPIAVCITPGPHAYIWQCLEGNGSTLTLAAAISEGLTYMTQAVVGDATVIDDLLNSAKSRLN